MHRSLSIRRRQSTLIAVAAELARISRTDSLLDEASSVRSLLYRMSEQLRVHLSLETESAASTLVMARNPQTRWRVRRSLEEMAEMRDSFSNFVARWPVEGIRADPALFMVHNEQMLRLLAARILGEDEESDAREHTLGRSA